MPAVSSWHTTSVCWKQLEAQRHPPPESRCEPQACGPMLAQTASTTLDLPAQTAVQRWQMCQTAVCALPMQQWHSC